MSLMRTRWIVAIAIGVVLAGAGTLFLAGVRSDALGRQAVHGPRPTVAPSGRDAADLPEAPPRGEGVLPSRGGPERPLNSHELGDAHPAL